MIISEIVPVQVIGTNVIENIPSFDNTQQLNFPRNTKLESGGGIYQFIGDYVFAYTELSAPPAYLEADEINYAAGDVIFKDNKITRVETTGSANVAKQPSEYTQLIGFARSFWNARYTLLKSNISGIFEGFEEDVGGVKHRLHRDYETWGWKYSISYPENEWVFSDEEYSKEYYTYAHYNEEDNSLVIMYHGNTVFSGEMANSAYFEGTDGNRYKTETLMETVADEDGRASSYYFAISSGVENISMSVYTEDATVSRWCDKNIHEDMPIIISSTDDTMWLGQFFILSGSDLYMRTSVDTAVTTKDVTTPQYSEIVSLDQFPNFVFTRVSDKFRAFDGRNNTVLKRHDATSYTLSTQFKFDTLAISGVIAKDIDVTFRRMVEGLLETVRTIVGYVPDTRRDRQGNLSRVGTTAIFYSSELMQAGDIVDIIISEGTTQIGEILLGTRGYAGKTNYIFNNTGKAIAPLEKDVFGVFHNRKASVDVFSGSADFKLDDYDMIGRFVQSIDGKKVIVNGSDSDEKEDGESRFAKTRVVGILMEYKLGTRKVNKHLDEHASLNFIIEEVI